MVKHIVIWKFKDFADGRSKKENMEKVKIGLEALTNKVDGILKMEVGFNINPSDMAYDLVLYSEFTDEAALDAYQAHPEHLKVKELVGKVREDRVVIDYAV